MNTQHPYSEEFFMQRAFQLALLGRGYVSPNPLVGCVIEADGKIIGEGWHRKFGEAHAEVNAVNTVEDKTLLGRSTVYVNLEPCSHFGKTPPCADLLVHHKVKKVVISNVDSNPLVGGKGIQKLREAGIEVETGLMEKEGRALNNRFFTFIEKKRPYIILKWAQTADRYVARANYDSKWISGKLSRQLVHRWRAEESAILVGANTALYDNPQLTVRDWTGPNPVRIVIDPKARLSNYLHLFDGTVKTLVYTQRPSVSSANLEFIAIDKSDFLQALLSDLHHRGIQSIIVEGGANTLGQFISQNLWDEARVFTANVEFGDGIPAPQLEGNVIETREVDFDTLRIYKNDKA